MSMRFLSHVVAVLAFAGLACAATASPAHAEPSPFASSPGLLLSADRLVSFGQAVESSVSFDGSSTTVDTLNVFGAWGTSPSPLCDPRLGIDRVFASGWTSGGSVAFSTVGGKRAVTKANVTETDTKGSVSGLVLTPRVGYLMGLSPRISLWLRGGVSLLSYKSDSSDGSFTSAYDGVNVTVDPQLLITPSDTFGLAVGLVADLPLSGRQTMSATSGGIDPATASGGEVEVGDPQRVSAPYSSQLIRYFNDVASS